MERSAGHLDPGDVVVHHGLTIHHASANLTAKRRRAVTINYVAEHVAHSIADDLYQLLAQFQRESENVCKFGSDYSGAYGSKISRFGECFFLLKASCV